MVVEGVGIDIIRSPTVQRLTMVFMEGREVGVVGSSGPHMDGVDSASAVPCPILGPQFLSLW